MKKLLIIPMIITILTGCVLQPYEQTSYSSRTVVYEPYYPPVIYPEYRREVIIVNPRPNIYYNNRYDRGPKYYDHRNNRYDRYDRRPNYNNHRNDNRNNFRGDRRH